MKKTIRKWSVILLSIVMVLSLAVPALALSAEDYPVLNVRYAPNDNQVKDVVFTAYRLAEVSEENGNYYYTLTEAFKGAELIIDLNAVLKGKQVNDIDSDGYNKIRSAFTDFINVKENSQIIQKTEGASVKATTDEDGVAQFKGLAYGLYLVSTNYVAVYNSGRWTYTAIPFLLNIPYVYNGVSNNFITATVKFDSQYRPPREDPDDPIDIPDDDVPLGEPDIAIPDEEVPKTDFPDNPDIEIPDEDVPLASLPQTGLLWWPVPVMAASGIMLVISGVVLKRKAERDA